MNEQYPESRCGRAVTIIAKLALVLCLFLIGSAIISVTQGQAVNETRKDCRSCSDSGKCRTCDGNRDGMEKCVTCSASGKVKNKTCKNCNGAGRVLCGICLLGKCNTCKGAGIEARAGKCLRCNGTKECQGCDISLKAPKTGFDKGFQHCKKCNGQRKIETSTGVKDCDDCSGKGKVRCNECDKLGVKAGDCGQCLGKGAR